MADLFLSSFEKLRHSWQQIHRKANTRLLFSSPWWSESWFNYFGDDNELVLGAVEQGSEIIGIAPLRLENNVLRFIGGSDVCDFLDFIIEPGKEDLFFTELIGFIKKTAIKELDLSPLLAESTVMRFLNNLAATSGLGVSVTQDDVIVDLSLPGSLTEYLSILSGKQRHELLRKERRLSEEGDVIFRQNEQASESDLDTFLRFFRESRDDKRAFLTGIMESFFRSVTKMAAENEMLRLGTLELNSAPIAATLCFDYQNDIYLYNSGYDPDYRWLSAGLLSKYYCIKDSIDRGKKRFDFLKGTEKYKFHLGGKEIPLYRCIIKI